ncbi:MAG: hypothetical protein ACOX6V_01330 [Patescibacteria group bacterium]|jgi:hypothetical protein
MKKLIILATVLSLLFFLAGTVKAAPFKAADKNSNVVAYYEEGPHGIPGEEEYHEGKDLVMKAGNSGVFQQWFYGWSEEDGGIIEGDHSVWKLAKDEECPDNWFKMTVTGPDGDNYWGDYLKEGETYCIHTNDFRAPKYKN